MNKKQRVMCEVEMDFKTSFCRRSTDLSNDDIISAYVWKRKWILETRSELTFLGLK